MTSDVTLMKDAPLSLQEAQLSVEELCMSHG